MNRYPTWVNVLVLVVFLAGVLLALPNLYGTVPALQLADANGRDIDESRLESFAAALASRDIMPEAAYIEDGRAVFRFHNVEEQLSAAEQLRPRFQSEATVALTLAPKLPAWLREIGLRPMSLGLDLRGGVYVLLEVDMEDAIASRLNGYQQDLENRLRDARIRHRVDVDNGAITIRLQSESDVEAVRDIVQEADPELLVIDGTDGRSLQLRMSETQVRARQDFAIEQNITTLRNRVDQLGVTEPLVQRQGVDRIVVQLPGVQDPNQLDEILTATATLEFRLVDTVGNSPGSRRYPGREGIPSQILKRDVIASGDQIIHAEAGFSEGQPAVFITLDA
ncbi:MAG: protein translocase subunit SecD, partial [Woeseiaceae bacterium]|nr:protein translocase subunit SecD [Woeseiaceae bacterium]